MTGRFMEILRANGGDIFDKDMKPVFNSEAGVAALQWFVDIYEAGAVPAGTVNYTWDDIGQAMAAGQLAVDLDWPGWAAFSPTRKRRRLPMISAMQFRPSARPASAAAGPVRIPSRSPMIATTRTLPSRFLCS
nr:extracellular solute-binding protein [Marinicella sp. W31]MDC2878431.1 extracellular solute-binding protein [Marinicella sp. W31]